MIRITAKRNGFRRAGISHPDKPVEHPDDAFTRDQLNALKAEPMLDVQVIEDPKGKAATKPKGDKTTDEK